MNTITDLSEQQKIAATMIKEWYEANEGTSEIFRLFGYAGTGKTTTIRFIVNALGLDSSVLYGAYTGKAAMVMRKHGLPANTIHSLIYSPVPPNKQKCRDLDAAIKKEDDPEKKKELRQQLKEMSKVHFVRREKEDSELDGCSLLVLDECSMVNDEMKDDLLSFDVPLLVIGDPGQLPPVEGEGALIRDKPHYMLTEIHRQAKGNPIIDFSIRARNGIYIPKIAMGNSAHVSQANLSTEQVLSYDQILCGKNLTKQKLNKRIRGLKNFSGLYPVAGEKLICLRNDADKGLFNGMMCEVIETGELYDTSIELTIKRETDTDGDEPIKVKALRAHFDAYEDKEALENVKWWERTDTNEFDFGYCITVHKSQGSQWEKVLLWDDKFFVWSRSDRKKWLYTGITRAIDGITIAS